MPHLYSSVSGHLGCYHVLAIVNSAALDTGNACIFLNEKFCPDI